MVRQTPDARPRLMVVDDQTLFRTGLVELLRKSFEVVTEAQDGAQAVRKAAAHRPDVILMDVEMPFMNGIEAMQRVLKAHPEMKVIILTAHPDDAYVLEAMRTGASGYVLKDADAESIVADIRAVLEGARVMAPPIADHVFELATQSPAEREPPDGLTRAQVEILKLIAQGLAGKQIAAQLGISEKTVRNHVSRIYRRLHIFDRSQAVLYAIRKGLVQV